ncbi:MAG TPA: hypothetical protein VHZ55_00955 [Bryobacteraceae bacterium]|jgi:drug/metabolite transporter (DMT)-like permease|nr:hypothetical protein [Bryobacteraceae bacterium]
MEIAGTVVDALLLLRILQLKLQRTYLWITLAAVLTLLLDAVTLWYGSESQEISRVFIFSRFLWAFVFPAAAYDVWEELKTQVARIRRFAIFRLVASLVLAAILGLIIAAAAGAEESNGDALLDTFAVILWAATSTASLAFLWSMNRLVRAAKIEVQGNTSVWLLFYQLSLAAEVVTCFLIIIGQRFTEFVSTAIDVSLGLYSILITLWCIWKLRAHTSNVPSEPEKSLL